MVPTDQSISWADAAASDPNIKVLKFILRIVLKKTDKSASFFLSDKQKWILIFKQLDKREGGLH